MATKKQKRAAALAKRAEFLKKQEADGLEALRRDQHNRAMEEQAWAAHGQAINDRYREILARHGMHE